jgi:hypothetical protein
MVYGNYSTGDLIKFAELYSVWFLYIDKIFTKNINNSDK